MNKPTSHLKYNSRRTQRVTYAFRLNALVEQPVSSHRMWHPINACCMLLISFASSYSSVSIPCVKCRFHGCSFQLSWSTLNIANFTKYLAYLLLPSQLLLTPHSPIHPSPLVFLISAFFFLSFFHFGKQLRLYQAHSFSQYPSMFTYASPDVLLDTIHFYAACLVLVFLHVFRDTFFTSTQTIHGA